MSRLWDGVARIAGLTATGVQIVKFFQEGPSAVSIPFFLTGAALLVGGLAALAKIPKIGA